MEKQPVFLFEVTQRCDLQCKPCYDNILVSSDMAELKLWEWLIIVESIAEQNGKLIISGGDPFFRNDLMDIISYAKVIGVDVELATCGFNLTADKLSELKKFGIDGIIIRLDGISEEENDTYRGVKTYAQAMEAVERVLGAGLPCSVVVNSDIDTKALEDAYGFSRQKNIPLFIAAKPFRGAPSLIRSRLWKKLGTDDNNLNSYGTMIDPIGRIFHVDEVGLRYSGDVHEKKYKVIVD